MELDAYIMDEVKKREPLFRERYQRMDRWLAMYQLRDLTQELKREGLTRFVSDMPRVVVKRLIEVLTFNPERWHIIYDREMEPEREVMRKIELFAPGLFNDINLHSLVDVQQQAAWYALVRGWIMSQLWLSEANLKDTDTPVDFQFFDPRYAAPTFGRGGKLRDFLYSVEVQAATLFEEYPASRDQFELDDYTRTVTKYVWWDKETYAVLVDYLPWKNKRSLGMKTRQVFVRRLQHGAEEIPVQIVPVMGDPVQSVPPDLRRTVTTEDTGVHTARLNRETRSALSWNADTGHSILSSIEKAWPQYNETMAAWIHAGRLYAYPTLLFTSRDGGPGDHLDVGTGVVNPLSTNNQESLAALNLGSQMPAGLEVAARTLREEMSWGTVPFEMLFPGNASSGFHEALNNQVGMTAVSPWRRGVDRWQVQVAQSGLRQYIDGGFSMRLSGMDNSRTFFDTRLEPGEIPRIYDLKVEREPALPYDQMQKIQMARLALDPAKPLMSYQTAADLILGIADPDGEKAKIFEDIADMNPVVVHQRMTTALRARGVSEEAIAAIEESGAIAQLAQMFQKLQGMATISSLQAAMQPTGVNPSGMPPQMAEPMGGPQGGAAPPQLVGPNGQPLIGA